MTSFFRRAFPRATEMLGIVFTPVEIVDYVIHSIEHLLTISIFKPACLMKTCTSSIPFVGTGTFITRLLQSGIIQPRDLRRKYTLEIHANEIVLLAYYVAGINIEAVYHEMRDDQKKDYEPYERLVFQDTFQSSEQENQLGGIFPFNHRRIEFQQKLPLTVVFGNPPYSKGQKSQSDNAQNVRYSKLDERIANSYVKESKTGLANMLYDSYVRGFRWASDRLGEKGIVGFVTGAGWLYGNSATGIRACFAKEFAHIYVVNLRGNARLKGELWRKEGDKIFGQASRSAITLTFLVKDTTKKNSATIHYHDIGDYLKRNQKLAKLTTFQSIAKTPLKKIEPNEEHDWLDHRNPQHSKFLPLHSSQECNLFRESSKGMNTARDAWAYNFSKSKLSQNVRKTSRFFNKELSRHRLSGEGNSAKNFVDRDRTKIAWNREMLRRFEQQIKIKPNVNRCLRLTEYRPFTKVWCYFDPALITVIGKMPRFYSSNEATVRMLCTAGMGAKIPSFWQVKIPTDLNMMSAGANCYPITIPVKDEEQMFEAKNVISNVENAGPGFNTFKSLYPKLKLDFKDFFNYAYAIFHCPDYIELFYANLQKELPRIPAVESDEEVLTFVKIGSQLSKLHVEYEDAKQYPVDETWSSASILNSLGDDKVKYRVDK